MTLTQAASVDPTFTVDETQVSRVDYTNFGIFQGECRVFDVQKVKNKDGTECLWLTFLRHLQEDGQRKTSIMIEVFVPINSPIMEAYEQGLLTTGRSVTLSGEIQEIRTHYIDQQRNIEVLWHPTIRLNCFQMLLCLGAAPPQVVVEQ